LTFIGFAASCEAMKLAEQAGLDLQQLGRVVRHTDIQSGGPGAVVVRENMDTLEPDNFLYAPMAHARDLGEKDLSLALALGESVGVDLPLAEIALKNLAAGLGVPHAAASAKE
jgi:3-hydroxyisobutyrate dehydrogenase-like beta-hydroxyacid dehydrogenase